MGSDGNSWQKAAEEKNKAVFGGLLLPQYNPLCFV